ncbi:NAD(P)H-dependent oxidoreductase [Streptomyces sp. URMC 123]|uniref:NAD(P)H-dependent oxidoreductase n=1 Tax=Streptomyces sp. URMC 123 TaxID=3423403 RepID=UPI003F1CE9C4
MDDVRLLGLCAPSGTEPCGELLLRALAVPGSLGVRLEVCAIPEGLPAHSAVGAGELPPGVRELRARAARAGALVIATPETRGTAPEPIRTALDWLAWPRAGSPLVGKYAAVLTTTEDDAPPPESFTDVEYRLLCAGAEPVGPRTITPRAMTILHPARDGRVLIADPASAMRLLLHIRRTAKAVRSAAPRHWPQ